MLQPFPTWIMQSANQFFSLYSAVIDLVCDSFFLLFDFILGALFLFVGGDSWDGRAQGRLWPNRCYEIDF